jgi:hypothetical protein
MKKLILMMILLCSIAISIPVTSCAAIPATTEYTIDQPASMVTFAAVEAQTLSAQTLQPPNAGFSDIIALPGEDATTGDKLYWLIAVVVILIWEIVFRLVPTSRSISLLTIAYNLLNTILKDRANNGGIFNIKKESPPPATKK